MAKKHTVPESLKTELQEAVDYLTEHPDKIKSAWSSPVFHDGGILFRVVHPEGNDRIGRLHTRATEEGGKLRYCGCLTQIRAKKKHGGNAYTPDLTKEIRADKRLPSGPSAIKPKHLPAFMEWMLYLAARFGWKS